MCATFIYWHDLSPAPAEADSLTVISGSSGQERFLLDRLVRDYQDRAGAKVYFRFLFVDADLFLHAFEFDPPDRQRQAVVAAMREKQ